MSASTERENTEDINLSAFSEKQQDAIIGWMVKDRKFFIRCVTLLEKGYFTSPFNGEIFKVASDWYNQYGHPPSKEELKGKFNLVHHDTFRKYHDRIEMCATTTGDFRLDGLSHLMTGWMKTVKLQHSIQESGRLFNKRDFSGAVRWIEKKIAEIRNTTFESDSRVSFNDTDVFFTNRKEVMDDCLTIGNPHFDKLLREGAIKKDADMSNALPSYWTNGGLVKGDTTIILGPSNAGKTTTLTSIIIPNILNKKYILYFTHEQKWEDIKTKLFMNACRATMEELESPSDVMRERLARFGKMLDEYLVYVPWVKSGDMWVESVINEITLQQEILMSTKGRHFDMLIDDYPGKLKSREMKGRTSWEELDYVYDQFVVAAAEWRFHGILPVQTNREGYKVNRGDHSDGRVIDQADAAGSFGIMQKADNVITLNRSPSEQAEGFMRFFISKSRTKEAQTTFATKTDFARSCTHGYHLTSMTARGNDDNSAKKFMHMITANEAEAKYGSLEAAINAGAIKPTPAADSVKPAASATSVDWGTKSGEVLAVTIPTETEKDYKS